MTTETGNEVTLESCNAGIELGAIESPEVVGATEGLAYVVLTDDEALKLAYELIGMVMERRAS